MTSCESASQPFWSFADVDVNVGISRCYICDEKPLASFTNCALYAGECFGIRVTDKSIYSLNSEKADRFVFSVVSSFFTDSVHAVKSDKTPGRFIRRNSPQFRRISSGNLANRNCVTFLL